MAATTVEQAIIDVQNAVTGNELRAAIVTLLSLVNSSGTNASTLDGKTIDYFATKAQYDSIIASVTLDSSPTKDSPHGVSSGGLYSTFATIDKALLKILGEEE